jgi:hypothetical protein
LISRNPESFGVNLQLKMLAIEKWILIPYNIILNNLNKNPKKIKILILLKLIKMSYTI